MSESNKPELLVHQNPELHINEEPSDDFMETGLGMIWMMTFIIVVSIIATIITLVD